MGLRVWIYGLGIGLRVNMVWGLRFASYTHTRTSTHTGTLLDNMSDLCDKLSDLREHLPPEVEGELQFKNKGNHATDP